MTPEPDPIELVRRALAAWNARDADAVVGVLAPDFEIDASENVFNPRVFRGPDSVFEFMEMVGETWEEWRFELGEASVDGDRVIATVRNVGRAKLSGVEVEAFVTQVWTVRDGLLASVKNYPRPMSHEDVVRRWLTTFAEDADAFRGVLHPDIEWFPFEENHTPSRGIDAGMRIRDQWVGAWEEMQAELEDLVEKGESVVATVHVFGIGKASGVRVDTRLYLHFKVRDDKIVYLYEYEQREPALEAAGLEPS